MNWALAQCIQLIHFTASMGVSPGQYSGFLILNSTPDLHSLTDKEDSTSKSGGYWKADDLNMHFPQPENIDFDEITGVLIFC